ncbi:MAG: DNA polymerase ligase N-terminal domain-containing protein [Candidatus Hydrothermarchaeaceae archaeon]
MSLDEYRKKRNFSKTSEPKGEDAKDVSIFVVQRHRARNLHYDFRLSIDGVLKSWAVPKEPPVSAGVKRLAVETEEHPVSYASFEGEIPEGEYGAGKVEIWDSGSYNLESRKDEKIVFTLKGRKMRGKYVLLRFGKAGRRNWLLFKT